MTPGLHPTLTAREYFQEPCPAPALTASGIKTLLTRTPKEFAYEHPALNADCPASKDSIAKRFGDVAHQLALGKGRGYVVSPYAEYRSNEAKTWRDAAVASGMTPIKPDVFADAERASDVMRDKIEWTLASLNHGVVPAYQTELVATWQEPSAHGPVWARLMADVWCEELGVILDPKFSPRLAPGAFEAHATAMGWDMQGAWYRRGFERLFPERAGRIRFINLVVSPDQPHVSRAMEADEATRYSCEMEIERAIARFADCLHAGKWPGYPDAVETWRAREWTINERAARAVSEDE